MTNAQHVDFSGTIPEFYDRHLGPVMFEPYARDLARRISTHEGVRVLEIACGTGIATRRMLDRLPSSASLVATDLNQGMVDYARATLPADARIVWRTADAQALPFEAESFDSVVMQFGIMFMPDKLMAIQEARRMLKPGGRLILSAWGSFERNPFGRIINDVLTNAFSADPPTFYQVPFSDPDPAEHRNRLEAAGFRDVRAEAVGFESMAESAEHFANGLVRGNPVALVIQERGTVSLEEVEHLTATALRRELGDRPVRVMLEAWLVSGTA